jgi:hypothetical protein
MATNWLGYFFPLLIGAMLTTTPPTVNAQEQLGCGPVDLASPHR